ncbi:MAG: Uma2 family endonuclease [Hyphomicrobiaceae bacterium]|nr:Uma2 family endonuclease [Hyphomicrobiaceae bacterium]
MLALPTRKLTFDEFLAWTEGQPGRYELYWGRVYAMAPERAGHAKVKFAVQTELHRAIVGAGLLCHMLPDEMTDHVDEHIVHEPDALVYCGPEVADDTVEIESPVIVVEVLSPYARHMDASARLVGYFQVASVQHDLIVDPEGRPTLHHRRQLDGTILTRIVRSGRLQLDPPGLEIDVSAFHS